MSTSTYYATCAFPKPVTKKKKPACNGYKDKQNRICAYTGERGAERHELFGGANRQTSTVSCRTISLLGPKQKTAGSRRRHRKSGWTDTWKPRTQMKHRR